MKNYRLTFNTSLNIQIPVGVYDIIYDDAFYFGYVKNDDSNLSGFLNHLIPALSSYQEDLHNRLLQYNGGDEERTQAVEQSIHNVYLAPFSYRDDAKINVPFRINKECYEAFIYIHDVKLSHYNASFSQYIRNLLTEYATKPREHREKMFKFQMVERLEKAIEKGNLCHFHTKSEHISFVPACYEVNPVTRHIVIAGCNYELEEFNTLMLAQVQNLSVAHISYEISDEECRAIYDKLIELFEKEKQKVWQIYECGVTQLEKEKL